MALAPLAAETDLPTGTTGDKARALKVASAAIRDAAGVPISQVAATVRVNAGHGALLRLPGPITDVTSVLVDGVAVTDYIPQPNGLWRACGWATQPSMQWPPQYGTVGGFQPVQVTVTYTFGLGEVPDDIVDLTVQLALAWLAHMAEGGGSTAGLASVRVDDASESYTEEASGRVSPVFIPEATRIWLAERFGGGVEVVEFL